MSSKVLRSAITGVGGYLPETIVTNDDLAKVCGLSVRAFERQFQAAYNSSPHDYIRQLRVRIGCSSIAQ